MLKLLWQAYTHTTTYLNTVFACTTKILLCICTLFCLIGERVDYYLYVTDWVMYVVVVLLKWYVVIYYRAARIATLEYMRSG